MECTNKRKANENICLLRSRFVFILFIVNGNSAVPHILHFWKFVWIYFPRYSWPPSYAHANGIFTWFSVCGGHLAVSAIPEHTWIFWFSRSFEYLLVNENSAGVEREENSNTDQKESMKFPILALCCDWFDQIPKYVIMCFDWLCFYLYGWRVILIVENCVENYGKLKLTDYTSNPRNNRTANDDPEI